MDVLYKIRHRSQEDEPYSGRVSGGIDPHFLVTKEDLWTGEILAVNKASTFEEAYRPRFLENLLKDAGCGP